MPEIPEKQGEPKQWTKYLSACTQHFRSPEYQCTLRDLFGQQNVSDIQTNVATSMAFEISQENIKLISKKVSTKIVDIIPFPQMSAAGRGKVRYVGGMCVAKMRYHYMNIVTRNMFKDKEQDKVEHAKEIVDLLSVMEMGHEVSEDPESLMQIERKQNLQMSLTNISDVTADFFILVTHRIHQVMTVSNLQLLKEGLFFFVSEKLNSDSQLNEAWKAVFPEAASLVHLSEIFDNIIQRFIRVSAKQFRKDVKDTLKVEKEKAHRHKVKESSKKAKEHTRSVTMKEIISGDKSLIHLKLKVLLHENQSYFESRDFTRPNLILICQAYGVEFRGSDRKDTLAKKIKNAVLSCGEMPNPAVFTESTSLSASAGTSKAKSKEKGKGKGKGKSSKKTLCKVCQIEYGDTTDWIQCETCSSWLHRVCAGLANQKEWDTVQDIDWNCQECVYFGNEDSLGFNRTVRIHFN